MDKLKLENFNGANYWDKLADDNNISRGVIKQLFDSIHGRFVYDVVGWLNAQGY